MTRRILITMLCSLLCACTDTGSSLLGFWVDPQGRTTAEFTDEKMILTSLTDRDDSYIADYEKIDDSRFFFEKSDGGNSPVIVVDWKSKSFSIPNKQENIKGLSFTQAPNVDIAEILGAWNSHNKDENSESSVIVTYRETSYDYDSLEINHKKKTYKKQTDLEVAYTFENGFMFTDPGQESGEKYIYFIKSFSKNIMVFMDSTGYEWTQHRKDSSVHTEIPEGYTDESIADAK